ncbi:uncharacterized protein EHS24_001673 [Apiotrichum porosum]|uniref:Uncharacterized protein n=1 Tax=Apiotrichum porosum TaxID=105984 RepID=A0A427XJ50_9TREE|nr:uncharacterized protein EHS24_001673 [Apiotrichum porosum]RSH78767.1 hypothetical protein EHS24_001673 [Apiotrichum porosum]
MDTIIAYAPYSTLIALRSSSREYRKVVDKHLGRIIVTEAGNSTRRLEISSVHSHLPTLYEGCGLDGEQHINEILSIATVVDFVSPISAGSLASLLPACRNARVIRNRYPTIHQPRASTWPTTLRSLISFTAFKTTVYEGVERLVINLHLDPASPSRSMQVIPIPASVRHVVFIVPSMSLPDRPPTPPWDTDEWQPSPLAMSTAQFNNIILQIANGFSNGPPHVRYTIVGVTKPHAGWFGVGPADGGGTVTPDRVGADNKSNGHAGNRGIIDTVHDRVRNVLVAGKWTEEQVVAAVKTIQFMTHEEYSAVMGVEQYALETIQ